MTDEELVQAFESDDLEEFPHASHVRVAWWYLRQDPILVALPRFRSALQRFAAGKGKPERYRETITIAYMLLIADRLCYARGLSWPEFAARNPRVFTYVHEPPHTSAHNRSDARTGTPRRRGEDGPASSPLPPPPRICVRYLAKPRIDGRLSGRDMGRRKRSGW